MRHALLLALAFVLTAFHVAAQDESLIRVGVIDLTGQNVSAAELAILSDRLRVELHNTGVFTVVERDRMEDILGEQAFQLSGCVDTYCVVEIGRLLGAEKMVAGSIGRLGTVYTMNLRLVDMQTGALERTALRDCECSVQEVLTRIVGEVAAELAGIGWAPSSRGSQPLERGAGTGMLFVESTPSGGRIIVNGRLSREITPATLRSLPAGEHVIRVAHENLFAEQRVRVLRDDLVKVNLALQPGTGNLFIESEPIGADVSIDGVPKGATPVFLRNFRAGAHRLRIGKPHHFLWDEEILVEHDRNTEIVAKLVPIGYLNISVTPANAQVWIDGYEIPRNERSRVPVSTGEHRIVAWEADCDSAVTFVNVPHGATQTVDLASMPKYAQLNVLSTPSGAHISSVPSGIGGVTPQRFDRIEPGRYTVTLSMENRKPYGKTVDLGRGQALLIHGQLDFTDQYLQRLEAERQIAAAKKRAAIKRTTRWTSFAGAVVAGIFAYRFNSDAQSAYDDARAAHAVYSRATTTVDAVSARNDYEAATKRGDDAAMKRNVFYGVSGALLSVGVTLWMF